MERETIAYVILFLVAVSLIGMFFYSRHHGDRRSYDRDQKREDRAYGKRMANKDEASGG